jgi:hypothetical protein
MISREFLLAGRAIFTVDNGRGEHYTYRVTVGSVRAFAGVLIGPDNSSDYLDLARFDPATGELTGQYGDDKRVAVLRWSLHRIYRQDGLPQGYSIRHSGRCGKCGRLLTTPESIESGIGPFDLIPLVVQRDSKHFGCSLSRH